MFKKLIAVALLSVSGFVNAATVTSVNITFGDFLLGSAPTADGINEWSGNLPLDSAGVLYGDAFLYYGSSPFVDLLADGGGITASYNDSTNVFEVDWSNLIFDFLSPSHAAPMIMNLTRTHNDALNTFTDDWFIVFTDGALISQTGYFHIEGNYTLAAVPPPATVPVPAAAWLIASGLVGLAGVSRRSS